MSSALNPRDAAVEIISVLRRNGHEALFAGGCVRDELLGRSPKDYDVATSARPEEVEALFPKTIAIGKAFGVIGVIDGNRITEVATFRKDIGIADGRRPETVHFCAAREDALRRDFTINGMFFDPIEGKLIDYVGGQRNLEERRIVAIGDPAERFREDHLRMLRAIRFTHTLGFEIDAETDRAIHEMAHLIQRISAERIENELTRTLTESARPGDALRHLVRSGLMEFILPEILPMIGQEQPPQFHPEGDVFEHTVLMLNSMNGKGCDQITPYSARELAYTVLLHDVGKPPTARMGTGSDGQLRIRFDGHAQVSAEMAEEILVRLKLPTKERKRIAEAIRGHMRFMDVQNMRKATLRRMIGAEIFDLELELHRLDCLGSHAMLDNYDFLHKTMEQMANEPVLPEPWINGRDLLQLGIKEGRLIGKILKEAYDAQMENRFANREELLDWIRTLPEVKP
ncbi:MAG: CCA tRNA nucleotidyltransferase [Lentisphaerae bacterium]|nr:CCA tRNA nucleotidyltransferase [Lentisphaerota bacterium]